MRQTLNLVISVGILLCAVKAGLAEPEISRYAQKHAAVIPAIPEALPKINLSPNTPAWHPRPVGMPEPSFSEKGFRLNWCQGIYNWLCAQQNPITGLVESFDQSKDLFLKDQAATYDQALAGMSFLIFGDVDRAKKILEFYRRNWEGKGFYNFYSSLNGRVGIEWRRHVGPNMWLALFIYQYTHMTQDKTFLPLAEGLCDWVISLPHYNGGAAMSDVNEPKIPWREVVSTENVIDVVAVFQMAVQMTEDFRKQNWYAKELKGSQNYLRQFAVKSDGSVARGYRPFHDGVDSIPALDTITWLIASSHPENVLSEYGVSVSALLRYAESAFGLTTKQGRGYDYTDSDNAKKANRTRLVSLEWSGEMAQVYWLLLQSSDDFFPEKQAYRNKLNSILCTLDSYMKKENDIISYPYANGSLKKTFSDGWYTPTANLRGGLAGSVASTCWRLFADKWNPLRLDQFKPLPDIKIKKNPIQSPDKKEIRKALLTPSALTSEGLTTAAWMNLKSGNQEQAKKLALKCIHLYTEKAKQEQAQKAMNGGLVLKKPVTDKVKERIFTYPALNDTAACWVILSKIDPALEKHAYHEVRTHYSLAQIWDPRGFFWVAREVFERDDS